MVYRNSWLAGLAALAFAFVNLNALIRPTEDGIAWQYIAIAALALGVVITWTLLTYRLKTWLVVLVNASAAFLAIVRVTVPETTRYFLPTSDTLPALGRRLDTAQSVIRTGVEPVVPIAGIVAIVMVVLWAAGGLLSWGLLKGHPYVALLPPLILALQFATMNRRPTNALTIGAFIALVALVAVSITSDERDQSAGRMAPRGRWAPRRHRPGPAATMLLVLTVAAPLALVDLVGGLVPSDGILDWRVDSPSLSGDLYGSDSNRYNPFIGIHQQLVSGGETIRFWAGIASEVPADQVYFQLMTMETYDGEKFAAGRENEFGELDGPFWEDPGNSFAGPTADLAANVVIDQLEMPWLPVPATPFAVQGDAAPYLKVRPEDGSVVFEGGVTSKGMAYRVDARIARPDLGVLATRPGTTELSVAFRQAVENGEAPGLEPPAAAAPVRPAPSQPERFLDLPTDDPTARIPELTALAREWTANLETPWEKGLALEARLRTFDYTTTITPDQAASDLAAWLLDPDSPNYRTGYCENFATAMAVLARTLGLHSRVVLGFTPGDAVPAQPGVYVVRDRNAHAWVELWMPNQGWVRFDPTPRPDRINPSTASTVEDDLEVSIAGLFDIELDEPEPLEPSDPSGNTPFVDPSEFPEFPIFSSGGDSTPDTGLGLPGWAIWALPILALLAVLGLGIPVARRWQRRRRLHRLHTGDIEAAWEDIVTRLGDLGRDVDETKTPVEVAAGIDASMTPLAHVYERSTYGPPNGGASEDDIREAASSLEATRRYLSSHSTRGQRLVAAYRPRRSLRRKPRWRGRRRS